MIRNVISGIVIAIVVVAAWRYFGGDFGPVLNNVTDLVLTVVNTGADAVLEIINKAKGII